VIAHITALTALLTTAGIRVSYVDGPEVPVLPYVLLWGGAGLPGVDQPITDVRTDIDSMIGVTAVALTPEAVLIVQSAVRAVLAPSGSAKTLTVTGRIASMRLADSQPITVDTAVVDTATNRHPCYGVDLYRLISIPA
jgi:hypothetical protein